jgi:hypothetical protein
VAAKAAGPDIETKSRRLRDTPERKILAILAAVKLVDNSYS